MRFKYLELFLGFQTKRHNKLKNLYNGEIDILDDTHLVIIKLSDSWILKLISRALILGLVILSFPWLNSVIEDLASTLHGPNGSNSEIGIDSMNMEMLPLLFRDLENEGLLKLGDRALFFSSGNEEEEEAIYNFEAIIEFNMDVVSIHKSDLQQQIKKWDSNETTFDFVFTHNYPATSDFIDRSLKLGGVVVVQLSDNPMAAFETPSNFKIVYLRRFDSTIMAMRKTSYADTNSATHRKLCGTTTEAKKAALKNLEDVLLEPPRAASGKSNRYVKRTRFLPDLMGDSLESYPRRVFIDAGLHEKDDESWFVKNYPTRNKDFEFYKIDTEASGSSRNEVPQIGMSDWLEKNVKENEYVVMKAEAEVVEDMVKSKAIRFVDELFLECKHQGIKRGKRSRRAYWECLSLYGTLRDEGVAVHQWWG